jgi:hypothetical protein
MLPIRTSSIFRSRWMALLWAGGIIWSAVEFAGSQPGDHATTNAVTTDASGAEVDPAQMQQAEKLLEQFGK